MKQSVIDILEELEGTGGRNDKEELLEANSKNSLLRDVFVAALDPYTVYYVNKFKMPKAQVQPAASDDKTLTAFLTVLLPDLANRAITGNEAKATVEAAFSMMDARQQKWCQRILLKNMRAGVQTTIERVWPGSIKTFEVQLAKTLKTEFDRKTGIRILDEVEYPVRVEPKLDGLRCVAVKQKGVVTFFTRNGSPIDTLPTIKAVLEKAKYDDFVLDAEIMGEDWNESASVVMSHKTKKDDACMHLNVFDALPLLDWVDQETELPLSHRVECASEIVDGTGKDSPVKHVKGKTVKNEAELMAFYEKCMNEGYEGIMLKDLSAPYKFKRSSSLLKMKPVVTYEGAIVDHYEGRHGTKREGLFGGFDVVLPNGIITRIGGGFNDKARAEIQAEGPDEFIGRIVEVEGQPDPSTKDGLTRDGKVRFPVFIRYRSASDVDPGVMKAFKAYKKASK